MTGSPGTETRSRPSWDEVWAHVAEAVSARSLCVRLQAGAVIVDSRNRIVATGYNGPPSGFEHRNQPCTEWCPRAAAAAWRDAPGAPDFPEWARAGFYGPHEDYRDCPAAHAEANALMAADRSAWQGGTIYIMGDPCFGCAKLIANSGLSGVVVRSDNGEHRDPQGTYEFLERCGLTVVVE